MRNWLVVLLVLCSCSNRPLKATDCARFKNGKFKLVIDGRTNIITRNGSVQTEEVEAEHIKLTFKVKWVDDCTYMLINTEENMKRYPDMPKNGIVTVTMTGVREGSYYQTATSNFSDNSISGEVVKIN